MANVSKTTDTAGRELHPPRHIAIIMDGNGRWANRRGLPRTAGHKAGAETFRRIATYCKNIGVQYLTVYAFSTENWKRSEEEVSYLMGLMKRYLMHNKKDALKKGIRIRVIGDKERLSSDLQQLINEIERDTATMDKLNLTFAINYGGRDEITRAVRKVMIDVQSGELSPNDMDETLFATYLDTKDLPDPDLMIRTSKEERISNFLLWQLAYSEFYFTEKLWPEFSKEDLLEAIKIYANRERRFGGSKKEDAKA